MSNLDQQLLDHALAEIERLRKALKIVVDSGENSARTASHKYADVVIAGAAYEAARDALQ